MAYCLWIVVLIGFVGLSNGSFVDSGSNTTTVFQAGVDAVCIRFPAMTQVPNPGKQVITTSFKSTMHAY